MGTPMSPLELLNLIINSVISIQGAYFSTFDIFFYLGTPLNRPEYVKTHLVEFPQELIDEYEL